MSQRLTKQGVPNLNARGHNGHKNAGTACRHWFGGMHVVIGTRWAVDRDFGDTYEEDVYGQKCVWCSTVREFR